METLANTNQNPKIELWNGLHMRVGHLGNVQHDLNILGHVTTQNRLPSLIYSLNGQPPVSLNSHVFRRIVENGDFNADIPIHALKDGENQVLFRAIDEEGYLAEIVVAVTKETGDYPLPVTIEWAKVQNLEDVGMVTDGKWRCDRDGLHSAQAGYDRVFLVGNNHWKDYEIIATVTLHGITISGGPQGGNVHHVGFCLRWLGHSLEDNLPGEQPKWGLHPRGALVGLTVRDNHVPPYCEFYPGDSEDFRQYGTFELEFGKPIRMKARCETLPDTTDLLGVTKYSFKVWNSDKPEPDEWTFSTVQTSETALRMGGVVLLAHEAHATFGNIQINNLP